MCHFCRVLHHSFWAPCVKDMYHQFRNFFSSWQFVGSSCFQARQLVFCLHSYLCLVDRIKLLLRSLNCYCKAFLFLLPNSIFIIARLSVFLSWIGYRLDTAWLATHPKPQEDILCVVSYFFHLSSMILTNGVRLSFICPVDIAYKQTRLLCRRTQYSASYGLFRSAAPRWKKPDFCFSFSITLSSSEVSLVQVCGLQLHSLLFMWCRQARNEASINMS